MLFRVPLLETPLLAGTTSDELEHLWPLDGVIVAMALGTTSGLIVDRAGLEIRIYRRRRELVSDDFGAEFVPACILGAADDVGVDWSELLLPVKAREPWVMQLRNVGPNTITPQIFFDYVRVGDESRLKP